MEDTTFARGTLLQILRTPRICISTKSCFNCNRGLTQPLDYMHPDMCLRTSVGTHCIPVALTEQNVSVWELFCECGADRDWNLMYRGWRLLC
jgi:hypothetical protein